MFRKRMPGFSLGFRNYSKSSPRQLFILSAVRTPFGLYKSVLSDFTASQLISHAFREALQRAVVPTEDISNVFLESSLQGNVSNEISKRTGFSKNVEILESTGAVRNFIKGAKVLMKKKQFVCMTGGVVSMSNSNDKEMQTSKSALQRLLSEQKDFEKLLEVDRSNFISAVRNGAFLDEIAEIIFRKNGRQIMVTEDEINLGNNTKEMKYESTAPADGAVAFVIATKEYIEKNKLVPIAKIVSFAENPANSTDLISGQILSVEKALKEGEIHPRKISRWEIDSPNSDFYSAFQSHFNVNSSLVNKDGSIPSLGQTLSLAGGSSLCHLTHSLTLGEVGCVVSCDVSGTASAVVIEKVCRKPSATPRLTLITKKLCPLCDDIKEQLHPFRGRFVLTEIDIEAEENQKFYELYKYEIPVLFLEGRFLCKHKLDANHFNRRLAEFNVFP